ncbi:hypothetical protein [Halalkalibacter lacteus]
METNFADVVKQFELKLNRKLTNVEYHMLYSNFIKSSKNRK